MSKQTILYFVSGALNEKQEALAMKTGAKIRDVNAYHEDDAIEICDAVMGEVPERYLERFEKSEHFDAAKRLVKTEAKSKTESE